MAGIIRRAPEGSMIVIFTMLSKTEGGPLVFVAATAGDAAVADRVRCAVRAERRLVAAAGTVDRASLRREEDIMKDGVDCYCTSC